LKKIAVKFTEKVSLLNSDNCTTTQLVTYTTHDDDA